MHHPTDLAAWMRSFNVLFVMHRFPQYGLLHKIILHKKVSHAGVFVSSWLGGLLLQLGEWIIKKLPLVKHIYSAAKQVDHTASNIDCKYCSTTTSLFYKLPTQFVHLCQ